MLLSCTLLLFLQSKTVKTDKKLTNIFAVYLQVAVEPPQCIKTSLKKSHFIELRAKRVLRFFQPFLPFEKLFKPLKLCLYSK